MTVRILGLGNPILSDDAVGIEVARRLMETDSPEGVEIREVECGGMDLLPHLEGCDAAVIVDSIISGSRPVGEIFETTIEEIPASRRLKCAHDADLGSLIEIGRRMGLTMPRAVRIIAVEVADNITFKEQMTPAVERAVSPAAVAAMEAARNLNEVYRGQE